MDEETEAQGGMLWPEHCSGDGDRPGPLDFPGAVRGGASPSHPRGRRQENRNRNNSAACCSQGLLMSLHLLMWSSSLRMPPEKVLLSPCYRQRNCGPGRLRRLPNITQQIHSSLRIQTQIPLILSIPHRLLGGQFTPTGLGQKLGQRLGRILTARREGSQANK